MVSLYLYCKQKQIKVILYHTTSELFSTKWKSSLSTNIILDTLALLYRLVLLTKRLDQHSMFIPSELLTKGQHLSSHCSVQFDYDHGWCRWSSVWNRFEARTMCTYHAQLVENIGSGFMIKIRIWPLVSAAIKFLII